MARGKRSESNGLDAANALKAAKESAPVAETEAVEGQEGEEESPGLGHNQPTYTSDERFALLSRHKQSIVALRAAKKEAATAVKDAEKLCKSELGDEAVAEIDHMILLETAEGEAKFKKTVEREVRVAKWMGLPVGANGNLFDDVDRTPSVDRAAGAGKRAGLAGERAECPHDPSTEQYTAWMTGYHEGQKIAFNIKPIEPIVAADESDEFDTLIPADEPPAPQEVAVS